MLGNEVNIAQALGYSLLGFAIVFAGLILLMGVIAIMGFFTKKNKNKIDLDNSAQAHSSPVSSSAAVPDKIPAPGSFGEIKLNDVEEKQAAMAMAIVADEMNVPLNELRFISIKKID